VIWQYGKRGEQTQTVLTIGKTQVENNYRLRVISNYTNGQIDKHSNSNYYDQQAIMQASSSMSFHQNQTRVISNNLEIRKLTSSDSGWYECQLPTKPTQINYIYLEVLSKKNFLFDMK
jgi:hypothetical protein